MRPDYSDGILLLFADIPFSIVLSRQPGQGPTHVRFEPHAELPQMLSKKLEIHFSVPKPTVFVMMEPSVLDYARFHGVATDHLTIDPVTYLPSPEIIGLAVSLNGTDKETEDALGNAQNLVAAKQREKLDISKAGAIFLSSLMKARSVLDSQDVERRWDDFLPERRRIQRMKMEEPVLKSDHELDMLSFRAEASLDMMELDFPLEELDDEKDEGLAFPKYCQELPGQIEESIMKEKLDCTKEVLLFMQKVRSPLHGSVEGLHQPVYDGLSHTWKQTVEPITPPLLPREPTPAPFIPFSAELEILPDRELDSLPEYEKIRSLLAEDSILGEHTEHPSSQYSGKMLLDISDANVAGSVERRAYTSPKRPMLIDPKVDGPMTPPISAKKRCLEQDKSQIHEILAKASFPPCPTTEGENKCGPIINEELAEEAIAAKDKIEDKLNAERFRTIDPSVRTEVPNLENVHVSPPWSSITSQPETSGSSYALVSQLTADLDLNSKHAAVEEYDQKLPWNPFPEGIGRIDITESLDDTDNVAKYIHEPHSVCGSDLRLDVLPCRRWRSRLLSCEDSSDEDLVISPNSLAKSNQTSREEEEDTVVNMTVSNNTHAKIGGTDTASYTRAEYRDKNPGLSSLSGLKFSASGQLSKFMDLRKQKFARREVEKCSYFEPPSGTKLSPNEDYKPISDSGGQSQDQVIIHNMVHPVPDIPDPPTQRTLILSCSLLRSHRIVIRNLEAISPSITLIFRDYSSSSFRPALTPLSAQETQQSHDEADIILCPTTGILLTTSQETTQRYLPGQRPGHTQFGVVDSPLQERICRVCTRYEHLYVLLSHSTSETPEKITMHSKTADSVRSFISFCSFFSSLHCHITPLIVPSSADPLTQWIVSLANKHHFSSPPWVGPSISTVDSLLTADDPTVWELFLQRTGLNPYAAQAVLLPNTASPTASDDAMIDTTGPSPHQETTQREREDRHGIQEALRRFLSMDPRERTRIYGPMLGVRVLSRISKQIDTVW